MIHEHSLPEQLPVVHGLERLTRPWNINPDSLKKKKKTKQYNKNSKTINIKYNIQSKPKQQHKKSQHHKTQKRNK